MERKFKGLIVINDVLDDRYQKLSDRYHNLELSHNRKVKALKTIRDLLETTIWSCENIRIESVTLSVGQVKELIKFCDDALFSNGRERCRIKSPMRKKGTASS